MNKKHRILWFDTETSGFDSLYNDVLTGFFFIEEAGKIIDYLDMKVQPYNWDGLTKSAEEIHKLTSLTISKFEKPNVFFTDKFIPFLKRNFINTKFICAGYNIKFDIRFVESYWAKSKAFNDKINFITKEDIPNFSNFNEWVEKESFDVMKIARFCQKNNITDFRSDSGKGSIKLETICSSLNINYGSHDASEDIIATKEAAIKLYNKIKANKYKLELFKKKHSYIYNLFENREIVEFVK